MEILKTCKPEEGSITARNEEKEKLEYGRQKKGQERAPGYWQQEGEKVEEAQKRGKNLNITEKRKRKWKNLCKDNEVIGKSPSSTLVKTRKWPETTTNLESKCKVGRN